jgi:hypothetical protein
MQGPIPKITKAKRTRGMAQVEENLLHKHKALSPNPSYSSMPPQKGKRKNEKSL